MKLVFFERWMDDAGPRFLVESGKVDLVGLQFDSPKAELFDAIAAAQGYQLLPSTETAPEFFPDACFLDRAPELLAVSAAGAGYDMVDVAACTARGILVVNQGGANADSVAQHAIAMMLALSKRIIQSDAAIRRPGRDWDRWDYMGYELTGRTLGIVGLGNIGRKTAEIAARTFSMRVIASDPYITSADFAERFAEPATLEDVMSQSDFVSVHCPLTDETRRMIGREEFGPMKPGALFIQTARGGIHDEAALADALVSGIVGGAGLDVFETEPPPPDHPLLQFDNVVVSPHNAGITTDCLFNMSMSAAGQWLDIAAGRRPAKLVNPEAWPVFLERHRAAFGPQS